MIPFVKVYKRHFHVTSKTFLRRITPRIPSNGNKQESSESNFVASSNYESSFPDYLGVESDENVITAKQQLHQYNEPEVKDTREKFYRTSFGIIRFDADNKPKYHGQYKRRDNFTFPHTSSEVAKVRNISENPSRRNQIWQDLPLGSSQKVSDSNIPDIKTNNLALSEKNNDDTNCIDNCYFDKSEIQSNKQLPESEELNYLEKDYFENLIPLKSEIQSNKQLPESEELNYLEKDYFENLIPLKNSLEQNASKYIGSEEKVDSAFCSKNHTEELSYLEKDHFKTLIDLESQHKQNFVDYINSEKEISNAYNTNQTEELKKELNYLEEDYFQNLNKSEDHRNKNASNYTNHEQNVNTAFDIKNQNTSSINNNFLPPINELDFIHKSSNKNCSSSNTQKSTDYNEDILKSSSSHFVKDSNMVNEGIYDKFNERNVKDKLENPGVIHESVCTNKSVNELIKKKGYEVNITKLSSNRLHKENTMPHKITEPLEEKSNVSKELHNDPDKSKGKAYEINTTQLSSNQLHKDNIMSHKITGPLEKKSNVLELHNSPDKSNDEMGTAYDLVKSVRREQKIPCQIEILKEKSIEEKLDSKGFRILKNQVPNLSYFTHDEIINLLKQNIVYSDDDLLILNKPYGLIMHDSETTKKGPCLSMFLDRLAKELDPGSSDAKLFDVHRLDKETTGCLLLPRNQIMAMYLNGLFAKKQIVKKYWILTVGVPDPPEGIIDMPISQGFVNKISRMVLHPKLPDDVPYKSHSRHGKSAITTYKVISESGNAALVEVFPKTGVKHQIRVHFGFGLGCPILGDHKYSHLDKLAPQKLPADMLQRLHVRQSKVRYIPMHIHAKSVGIPHYFDERDLFVNVPIPDYFKQNLKSLGFRKKDMSY